MTLGLSVLPLFMVAKMAPILTSRTPQTPTVIRPLRVTCLFLNESLRLWWQKALIGQTWSHVHMWSHHVDLAPFVHRQAGRENIYKTTKTFDQGLRGPLLAPSWLEGLGQVTCSLCLSFPTCESGSAEPP